MNIYEHTYIAAPEVNKKDMENIENKIDEILKKSSGKICKILTDRVDGVDGAKSNDISTTDDENAMIIKITSLIFL